MTTDERHPITPTDGEPMARVSPMVGVGGSPFGVKQGPSGDSTCHRGTHENAPFSGRSATHEGAQS
jgi:hypothetical protein